MDRPIRVLLETLYPGDAWAGQRAGPGIGTRVRAPTNTPRRKRRQLRRELGVVWSCDSLLRGVATLDVAWVGEVSCRRVKGDPVEVEKGLGPGLNLRLLEVDDHHARRLRRRR